MRTRAYKEEVATQPRSAREFACMSLFIASGQFGERQTLRKSERRIRYCEGVFEKKSNYNVSEKDFLEQNTETSIFISKS